MINSDLKIQLLKNENKKLREQIEDLQLQLRLCDSELLINYKRFKRLNDYINEFGKTFPNGRQSFMPFKCVDNIRNILNGDIDKK